MMAISNLGGLLIRHEKKMQTGSAENSFTKDEEIKKEHHFSSVNKHGKPVKLSISLLYIVQLSNNVLQKFVEFFKS